MYIASVTVVSGGGCVNKTTRKEDVEEIVLGNCLPVENVSDSLGS